ncbi:hypothetical protein L7F22_037105 [Adiantum nelumboides]|nr:hypothetical protein [Adiantum nelumboides]
MATFTEKDDYYIRKFDSTNFTIWKQSMLDVLVNKGFAAPLKVRKENANSDDQWEELYARARATIRLHFGESIFFTIMDKTTAYDLWESLCHACDGKTASNKVFLMNILMFLSMKEGSNVSSHLNKFNSLFSQVTSKRLNFDDEVKAIFLLCSLPSSWDTFNTVISKSTHGGKLAFGDITSALFTEDIRRKSQDSGGHEVDQRSQWEKYLPLVEYAYNNTVHTSTGKTPFEVIEGRPKSPLLLKVHGKMFIVDEYNRDLKEYFQKIKEAISISQQKQKADVNKHRRALAFKENDWVLLKFPNARLKYTLDNNPTRHQKYYAKVAKRFYGPFQILKPINKMAYQLKLPNRWLIHNAFHVSLLKPYKGEPPSEAITKDPLEVEDQEEVLQPESILRHGNKVP